MLYTLSLALPFMPTMPSGNSGMNINNPMATQPLPPTSNIAPPPPAYVPFQTDLSRNLAFIGSIFGAAVLLGAGFVGSRHLAEKAAAKQLQTVGQTAVRAAT